MDARVRLCPTAWTQEIVFSGWIPDKNGVLIFDEGPG
jgi:hypothetical protein